MIITVTYSLIFEKMMVKKLKTMFLLYFYLTCSFYNADLAGGQNDYLGH